MRMGLFSVLFYTIPWQLNPLPYFAIHHYFERVHERCCPARQGDKFAVTPIYSLDLEDEQCSLVVPCLHSSDLASEY